MLNNSYEIQALEELGASEIIFSPKVYDLERAMRLWEMAAASVLA
ncbi:hypothetical protein [Rhizorhabdus argentea]